VKGGAVLGSSMVADRLEVTWGLAKDIGVRRDVQTRVASWRARLWVESELSTGGQPVVPGGDKDGCRAPLRGHKLGARCHRVRGRRTCCCWAPWMAWLTLAVADWLPGLGGWDVQECQCDGGLRRRARRRAGFWGWAV
jgi:hypothetical protein